MLKVTAAEVSTFLNSSEIDSVLVKNQDKFKSKWANMIEKGEDITPMTSMSWNWAAFFLQDYWLLYRKMFSLFWLIFILRLACYIAVFILPSLNFVLSLVGLALWIGIALYGNGAYLSKCLKLYRQGQAEFLGNETGKHAFLRKAGGTSIIFPILLLLLTIVGLSLGVLYTIGSMTMDAAM